MNSSPPEKPKKKPPVFFMIIFGLSVFGIIQIIVTGESSFRSDGPYTMHSAPDKFWFDLGLLIFFAVISAMVIYVKYSKKIDHD